VHDVFGFRDLAFQSLYHFTVGGPVDDPRLTTLAALRRAGRRAERRDGPAVENSAERRVD